MADEQLKQAIAKNDPTGLSTLDAQRFEIWQRYTTTGNINRGEAEALGNEIIQGPLPGGQWVSDPYGSAGKSGTWATYLQNLEFAGIDRGTRGISERTTRQLIESGRISPTASQVQEVLKRSISPSQREQLKQVVEQRTQSLAGQPTSEKQTFREKYMGDILGQQSEVFAIRYGEDIYQRQQETQLAKRGQKLKPTITEYSYTGTTREKPESAVATRAYKAQFEKQKEPYKAEFYTELQRQRELAPSQNIVIGKLQGYAEKIKAIPTQTDFPKGKAGEFLQRNLEKSEQAVQSLIGIAETPPKRIPIAIGSGLTLGYLYARIGQASKAVATRLAPISNLGERLLGTAKLGYKVAPIAATVGTVGYDVARLSTIKATKGESAFYRELGSTTADYVFFGIGAKVGARLSGGIKTTSKNITEQKSPSTSKSKIKTFTDIQSQYIRKEGGGVSGTVITKGTEIKAKPPREFIVPLKPKAYEFIERGITKISDTHKRIVQNIIQAKARRLRDREKVKDFIFDLVERGGKRIVSDYGKISKPFKQIYSEITPQIKAVKSYTHQKSLQFQKGLAKVIVRIGRPIVRQHYKIIAGIRLRQAVRLSERLGREESRRVYRYGQEELRKRSFAFIQSKVKHLKNGQSTPSKYYSKLKLGRITLATKRELPSRLYQTKRERENMLDMIVAKGVPYGAVKKARPPVTPENIIKRQRNLSLQAERGRRSLMLVPSESGKRIELYVTPKQRKQILKRLHKTPQAERGVEQIFRTSKIIRQRYYNKALVEFKKLSPFELQQKRARESANKEKEFSLEALEVYRQRYYNKALVEFKKLSPFELQQRRARESANKEKEFSLEALEVYRKPITQPFSYLKDQPKPKITTFRDIERKYKKPKEPSGTTSGGLILLQQPKVVVEPKQPKKKSLDEVLGKAAPRSLSLSRQPKTSVGKSSRFGLLSIPKRRVQPRYKYEYAQELIQKQELIRVPKLELIRVPKLELIRVPKLELIKTPKQGQLRISKLDTPFRQPTTTTGITEIPPEYPRMFKSPSFTGGGVDSFNFRSTRKVKQKKKYTPTGYSAVFTIKGKRSKAGEISGLGLRPISKSFSKKWGLKI